MEHANPAAIFFILLFVVPTLYCVFGRNKKTEVYVRRIPGVDAIDEGIGRAIELGRPISFTSGLTSVGPVLYSCLGVLRHIAEKCAVFGSKLLIPTMDPEALALIDSTVQQAYQHQKAFSKYDPTCVRFLSTDQFAFASGYMGIVHREQVGSAFMFGVFAAESLILAESGQQVGALQVAATISNEQIPFFITACDYTLIGEELYAAGAYLSTDPVLKGSLRGQDITKALLLTIIAIGIAFATWRSISPDTAPEAPSKLFYLKFSELF